MSDSTRVISRFVAVLFFLAAAAGVYGVMTHSKLAAAEQRLSAIEQERDTLKDKLTTSEKAVTENTSAAKSCMAEVETFKSRAATAESALESMKGKKAPQHSTAG